MRAPGERGYLVAHSIAKFRRAVRLRPEFDRACYNLGTVVYAHAGALAAPGALSPQLSQARPAAAAACVVQAPACARARGLSRVTPGSRFTGWQTRVEPQDLQRLVIFFQCVSAQSGPSWRVCRGLTSKS